MDRQSGGATRQKGLTAAEGARANRGLVIRIKNVKEAEKIRRSKAAAAVRSDPSIAQVGGADGTAALARLAGIRVPCPNGVAHSHEGGAWRHREHHPYQTPAGVRADLQR